MMKKMKLNDKKDMREVTKRDDDDNSTSLKFQFDKQLLKLMKNQIVFYKGEIQRYERIVKLYKEVLENNEKMYEETKKELEE